jgi:predicted metallopeptidase
MTATLCTDEIRPLVEKLVAAYPSNLSEIDPSRLIYIKGKGKRRAASISAIKSPYDLFVNQKFILTVHGPKYDNLSDDKKAIAIFDELIRVKDFESGDLKGYGVVSNYETLVTWGLDWLEAEDADVAPVFKGPKKAL